jgi:hypothetical protein
MKNLRDLLIVISIILSFSMMQYIIATISPEMTVALPMIGAGLIIIRFLSLIALIAGHKHALIVFAICWIGLLLFGIYFHNISYVLWIDVVTILVCSAPKFLLKKKV